MEDVFEKLSEIGKHIEQTQKALDTSKYYKFQMPSAIVENEKFDKTKTLPYILEKQTKQINESNEKMHSEIIVPLQEQNKSLNEICETLKDEIVETKNENKKLKIINVIMVVISIVSMLVAIAAWLFPMN